MRKKYVYDNAVIYVVIPNSGIKNLHKATEHFLKRVMAEKLQRGEQKYGD